MEVIHVQAQPPRCDEPVVLAIGKFDGVHIGHQKILSAAKTAVGGAKLAVMSFWPHPAWVLGEQDSYHRALTPFREKCRLLEQLGVERLYHVEFTKEYAATSAESFVFDHLSALNLKGIVVGADFRFGQGGKADVSDLSRMCERNNVPVTVVSAVEENGAKVSSSQIRRHIESGRVEAAEALLGRPYTVEGEVVHGDARGRLLGFPTANLDTLKDYVLPSAGVYAVSVSVSVGGQIHRSENWFGVLNAGTRPTVNGQTFRLEVHLLDYHGDLYGRSIRVSFLRRVRDERRFASMDELVQQIDQDVKFVTGIFAG